MDTMDTKFVSNKNHEEQRFDKGVSNVHSKENIDTTNSAKTHPEKRFTKAFVEPSLEKKVLKAFAKPDPAYTKPTLEKQPYDGFVKMTTECAEYKAFLRDDVKPAPVNKDILKPAPVNKVNKEFIKPAPVNKVTKDIVKPALVNKVNKNFVKPTPVNKVTKGFVKPAPVNKVANAFVKPAPVNKVTKGFVKPAPVNKGPNTFTKFTLEKKYNSNSSRTALQNKCTINSAKSATVNKCSTNSAKNVLLNEDATSSAQTGPENNNATSSAQTAPENKNATSSAQTAPENKDAASSAQTVPENKDAVSSAQTVPENKDAVSSAQTVPENKDAASSAQTAPENKEVSTFRESEEETPGNRRSSNPLKMEDFDIGKPLGKGKFGLVFTARYKPTLKIYAFKVLFKKSLKTEVLLDQVSREIEIQSKLRHPNVLRFHCWFQDELRIYLVLEYAKFGDLFHLMNKQNDKRFHHTRVASFIHQVSSALAYCHRNLVIHRDIKPENILVCEGYKLKIADFGWSIRTSQHRMTYCGTLDYQAPELVKSGVKYDEKVDCWAVGILAYELIQGKPSFEAPTQHETHRKIVHGNVRFSNLFSLESTDFIRKVLRKEPQERLTMAQMLQHPWLAQLELSNQ